ncbi:MAG: DNA alkylation repair protein [Promethearchaeota archaeon]
MVSISASKLIRERTREFSEQFKNLSSVFENSKVFQEIQRFLEREYALIPQKERIGKGIIYISKHATKEFFSYLRYNLGAKDDELFLFMDNIFDYGEENESEFVQHFSLLLLSELILNKPEVFSKGKNLIKKFADHGKWAIRESTRFSILSGMKKNPEKTLSFLSEWIEDDNENVRRLVAESLRPISEIKWLRNPSENEKILDILTFLRKDPSIYVRKSVGNNLKDLTKYMPEKILNLMEQWIKKDKIMVHDELSSEKGLSKEIKRLLWTMKHAMRWIKEKNPDLHPRLERILGKNYVLYFNEKNNRLALPK